VASVDEPEALTAMGALDVVLRYVERAPVMFGVVPAGIVNVQDAGSFEAA
jgi:hypothetical protein